MNLNPRIFIFRSVRSSILSSLLAFWSVPTLAHATTNRCGNLFRNETEIQAAGEFAAALNRWKSTPAPSREALAQSRPPTASTTTRDVDLDLNFKTSVLRSIPRSPRPGNADAFFTDANGSKLPSLAEESGYRFNNVVALSEVLYVAEVAKGSAYGREGEITFFDYDPATSSFHRIIEFQGFEREQAQAAEIFRDPRNRKTAQGIILESGLLEITTQTHTLRVETPEAMQNEFGGGLWIHQAPASHLTRTRVTETTSDLNADPVFLRTLTNSNTKGATAEATGLYSMDGELLKSWDQPEATELVRAFRIDGGFIAQTKNSDGHLGPVLLLLETKGRAERLIESDPRLIRLKRKMGPLAWVPSAEK